MPKANVYNMAGKQVGEIDLSDAIFGIEPNESVVHDVVKNHLSNCRQGTQPAPRSPAAARSLTARRAPAAPVRAPPGPPSGPTAASCSPPSPAPTATPSTRR